MSIVMMLKLSVLLCLLVAVAGYRICFDQHCYPMGPPFTETANRPFAVNPYPCFPSFFLLTRKNLDHPEEICSSGQNVLKSSYFNNEMKTYIIIHGVLHSAREPCVLKLSRTILEKENANVIMMDWSRCSWNPYARIIQDARTLGTDLAQMIGYLERKYQYDVKNISLIGYNVGAHIAGQAGKIKKHIGTIIALDPSVVMFDGDEQLHVGKNDAIYVKVFHTDTKSISELGFGFRSPLGHIDIYINGGRYMPECQPPTIPMEEAFCVLLPVLGPMGCDTSGYPTPARCAELVGDRNYTTQDIKAFDYIVSCDHFQVVNYYIDSILNPSKYIGRPCKTVDDCEEGVTEPCPEDEGCPQVGHDTYPPLCENCGDQLYYMEATVYPVLGIN